MTPAAASNVGAAPVRIRPPENATLGWYQKLTDTQFDRPGAPMGPLHHLRSGDHTTHRLAVKLAKLAELLPAVLMFTVAGADPLADLPVLPLDVDDALLHLSDEPALASVVAASLPLEAHDTSRLHIFRDPNGRTEHYAVEVGNPDRASPHGRRRGWGFVIFEPRRARHWSGQQDARLRSASAGVRHG